MNGYLDKSSTILSSPHADKVTRLVYDLLWRGVRGQVTYPSNYKIITNANRSVLGLSCKQHLWYQIF